MPNRLVKKSFKSKSLPSLGYNSSPYHSQITWKSGSIENKISSKICDKAQGAAYAGWTKTCEPKKYNTWVAFIPSRHQPEHFQLNPSLNMWGTCSPVIKKTNEEIRPYISMFIEGTPAITKKILLYIRLKNNNIW
jgi:hypothetical protein